MEFVDRIGPRRELIATDIETTERPPAQTRQDETPIAAPLFSRDEMATSSLSGVGQGAAAKPLETTAVFGLGPAGLLAMVTAVSNGQHAIGVELRNEYSRPVHFNFRPEFVDQLALLDHNMEKRFGPQSVKLVKEFGKVLGHIKRAQFVDAIANPKAKPTKLNVPSPRAPNIDDVNKPNIDILKGASAFHVKIRDLESMIYGYLEGIQKKDMLTGAASPRVTLLRDHRIVTPQDAKGNPLPPEEVAKLPPNERGLWKDDSGAWHIQIEQIESTFDNNGKPIRKRVGPIISLGAPHVAIVAEGASTTTVKRLGLNVGEVKHLRLKDDTGAYTGQLDDTPITKLPDGANADDYITASAGFIAGHFEDRYGGPMLRRRISTAPGIDANGTSVTAFVRQILIGHERKGKGSWSLVEVPPGHSFDAPGLDPTSPEYRSAYAQNVKSFYLSQVSLISGQSARKLDRYHLDFGPSPFTLTEHLIDRAASGTNVVVIGDPVGNGHFLTSGGAMTASKHQVALDALFHDLHHGISASAALDSYSESVRTDSIAWLRLSVKEFTGARPVNVVIDDATAKKLHADGAHVTGAVHSGGGARKFGVNEGSPLDGDVPSRPRLKLSQPAR